MGCLLTASSHATFVLACTAVHATFVLTTSSHRTPLTTLDSGPSDQREQTERLLSRASRESLEGDVEMADYDDKKYVPATESSQERTSDEFSLGKGDLLGKEHVDPVLDAKMHLINNAIDEIGMTTYQWKLFVLNGFGYAVDSLILLIQSIVAGQAAYEFNPGFAYGLTVAAYSGMLVGALFWGLSADVIVSIHSAEISPLSYADFRSGTQVRV